MKSYVRINQHRQNIYSHYMSTTAKKEMGTFN